MVKARLTILILTLLAAGCAKPPERELLQARQTLAKAYSAGAPKLASDEYQAARSALADAEDLIRRGNYSLAKEILPFAESHAERAVAKVLEEQANLELRKIREVSPTDIRPPEQPKPPPTTQTKAAISTPPPVVQAKIKPAPAPVPPPPPPPPPRNYRVGEGETLMSIAARKEIYADGQLWPLLYRSNRDQIKDPKRIYPGQVLSIPRDLSESDKDEAREKARQLNLFSTDPLIRSKP
jgi:nucleoid-associated protein YgaU